jgi:hypothetical protein
MNNIEVYDSRPSQVGNAQQSLRQISFRTYEGIGTLGKSVIAVIYSTGRLCRASKLKIALLAVSTPFLFVTSCNFPQNYEPPSPTTPQTVETTEIPTFTPTAELTATPEPTPTLEPTATPTLTAEEAEKAAKEKIISDLFEHGIEAVAGVSLNSASETKDFLGENEMYKSLGTIKNNIDALVNNKIYSIEIPSFAEPLLASYQGKPNVNLKLREGEGTEVKEAPEGFWSIETRGFQDKSLAIFVKDDQGLWQAVFPRGKTSLTEWTMDPQASTDFVILPQQNTYGELVWVKPSEDAPWTAVQIDSAGKITAVLNTEARITDTRSLWTLAEGVERAEVPDRFGNWFEEELERENHPYFKVEASSSRTDFEMIYAINQKTLGRYELIVLKDQDRITDFFLGVIHHRMRRSGDFRGDWDEFQQYLAEEGKLVLSDISLYNVRTGEAEYFEKMEGINKVVIIATSLRPENVTGETSPDFEPRYQANWKGEFPHDIAFDPENPETIYAVMKIRPEDITFDNLIFIAVNYAANNLMIREHEWITLGTAAPSGGRFLDYPRASSLIDAYLAIREKTFIIPPKTPGTRGDFAIEVRRLP